MPNKHIAKGRHHIPKMECQVKNWAEYDAGLRRRGNLTLWVTEEAMADWRATPRLTPGGQAFYSDLAIETGLMLRLVFHLPLRQTEGLMNSVFDLMGVSLVICKPPPKNFLGKDLSSRAISVQQHTPDWSILSARQHYLQHQLGFTDEVDWCWRLVMYEQNISAIASA